MDILYRVLRNVDGKSYPLKNDQAYARATSHQTRIVAPFLLFSFLVIRGLIQVHTTVTAATAAAVAATRRRRQTRQFRVGAAIVHLRRCLFVLLS